MSCSISSGIGIACADLKRVGGVNKRIWLFNLDDLRTGIDVTQSYVSTLNLITYATLYKFEGAKYSHSAESKLVRTDAGNVSWEHTVNLKINNTTYQEDAVLEALGVAEVGAIVHTNNNEFLIYGAQNGLTCTEQVDPTGVKLGDDESTTVKLSGSEPSLPKRLIIAAGTSGNITQQTLFYLNSITSATITT